MGLRGTPSLCILGSPYSLGGLEPDGLSCLQISSESVDFLSNFVVLRSVDSAHFQQGHMYRRGQQSQPTSEIHASSRNTTSEYQETKRYSHQSQRSDLR